MLVTVVPMLAPMIIGTASGIASVPAPTKPTIVAVDTEDDWTSTVASIPTNSPASGFETLSKRLSVKSEPKDLIPDSSALTPTRKR